jgi:O-antigen ligase
MDLTARGIVVRWLGWLLEAIVLIMMVVSPWAFGAVDAEFEVVVYAALALVLCLWAVRILLEWQLVWMRSSVAVCLATLFFVGVLQMTPLAASVLKGLAPGAAHWYEEFLPERPEVLLATSSGEIDTHAGSTISLYPHATRVETVRFLAVFLCFAAVINNIASARSLWRLSVVAVINGAALSLFGLIQFFSSPRGVIYWTIPSSGNVFGPFFNSNHFAFYVNLCLGLGVGLLFARLRSQHSGPSRGVHFRLRRFAALMFHDPAALWLCGALALMTSSVAFSLSRAGICALIGGAAVCIALVTVHDRGFRRSGAILLTLAGALALLAWFGFARVESNLSTLWTGEALGDARFYLLWHAWPLVRDFPIWGTGYGTFQYVEPLHLHTARDVNALYQHAHNEYLEALIEGGVVRLSLVLAAIGFVCRACYRSLRSHEHGSTGALVLGAAFAIGTAIIHSFFEFGVHIPAIALLLTVIAAQVSAIDLRSQATAGPASRSDEPVYRFRKVAPPLAAVALGLVALTLVAEAERWKRVGRLMYAAIDLDASANPSQFERKVDLLNAAAAIQPGDAEVHLELAEAYSAERSYWQPNASTSTDDLQGPGTQADQLAIEHFLIARDLCPLLPAPHVRIATNLEKFKSADSPGAYLKRAKKLAAAHPELWFLCGKYEFENGEVDEAWRSWRRSIELSDKYLTRIVDQAVAAAGADTLLANLTGARPAVWRLVAFHLYPKPGAQNERRPFLEKALAAYTDATPPTTGAELREMALLYEALDRPEEAAAAYEAALRLQPLEVGWRVELAALLHESGRIEDARRHLVLVLGQRPGHARAKRLMSTITREQAVQGSVED